MLEQPAGGGVAPSPARGRAGGPVRDPAARGADRHRAWSSSPPWRRRRWSPSRCRAVAVDHIHAPRVSVREQATLVVERLRRLRHDDLPGAVRRLARHADRRRPLPGPAGALPGGGGRLRPGEPARRADGAVDRQRGRGLSRSTSSTGAPPRARCGSRAGAGQPTRGPTQATDDAGRDIVTEDDAGGAGGGARPSLEALLMVGRRADGRGHPGLGGGAPRRRGRRAPLRRAGRGVHRAGPRLRAAQGGRRLAVLHPRGVRRGRRARSCSRASRPGSPRPRWRPWPWSPTSSRCRGPGSRRSAGSTSTACMRTLLTRGLVEEAGQDEHSGAHLYRTTGYFLERIGVDLAGRAARAGALPAGHGRHGGRAGADGRHSGRARAGRARGCRARVCGEAAAAEPVGEDVAWEDGQA